MYQSTYSSLKIGYVLFILLFALLFISAFTYLPLFSQFIQKNENYLQKTLSSQASIIANVIQQNDSKKSTAEPLKLQLNRYYENSKLLSGDETLLLFQSGVNNSLEILLKTGAQISISELDMVLPFATEEPNKISKKFNGTHIEFVAYENLAAADENLNNIERQLIIVKKIDLLQTPFANTLLYTLLGIFLMLIMSWILIKIFAKQHYVNSQESLYKDLLQCSHDWIWEVNEQNKFVFSNDEVFHITGYHPENLMEYGFKDLITADTPKKDLSKWQQKVMLKQPFNNIEISIKHHNGNSLFLLLSGQPILNNNDELQGYRGLARDITALRDSHGKHPMEYTDPLTGLYNRQYFIDKLTKLLDKYHQTKQIHSAAVVFIDLEDFKRINQIHSQDVGDEALAQIGERLKTSTPKEHILSRYSGDQFVVLFQASSQLSNKDFTAMLEAFMEKILQTIHPPLVIDNETLQINSSIGAAQIPQDGKTITEILSHADDAKNHARRRGSNTYEFYDLETQRVLDKKIKTSGELANAIDKNELNLYYQLQFTHGKVTGMEALLRWQHPELKKILSASDFMPHIKDKEQIHLIDEWVVNKAAKDIALIHKELEQAPMVSINLSTQRLFSVGLTEIIENAIKRNFLARDTFAIETSENLLAADLKESSKIISKLNQFGVHTVIDHFGTGNMSLANLQSLGISAIKIDKSFIDNITTNHSDLQMCRAIIQLGQSLKLQVIAEGVETDSQKKILLNEGCKTMQGYNFIQPLPLDKVVYLLKHKPELL